MHSSIKVR